jgi:hypothetical protein
MSTLREAAQQALEALLLCDSKDAGKAMAAITFLRAALAQQEQDTNPHQHAVDDWRLHGGPGETRSAQTSCDIAEDGVCEVIDCCRKSPQEEPEPVAPYAWMAVGGTIWRRKTSEDDAPLYTHPPRREWKSLTEEEIRRMGIETPGQQGGWNLAFARAIEAALKEKNNG